LHQKIFNMGKSKNVTLLGLGKMGVVLAKLLLERGYSVTVWNRTKEKAMDLMKAGAVLAKTADEAVQDAHVIVICVLDSDAVLHLISGPSFREKLSGRAVINLTTASPKEAAEIAATVENADAKYLGGAILAVPEQMGQVDATICVSGSDSVLDQHRDVLETFAGNILDLGRAPSAASAFDQAVLFYMYGSFIGFFQGVQIARNFAIDVALLGETIRQIGPGLAEFIKYEADVIRSSDFSATQSTLAININAVNRMFKTASVLPMDQRFPKLLADYFKDADARGLQDKELAALTVVFEAKANLGK
jgi:3-hydroxyisobutyrate dehydrogenase-like beta-hydroxyacid dehydrogenase